MTPAQQIYLDDIPEPEIEFYATTADIQKCVDALLSGKVLRFTDIVILEPSDVVDEVLEDGEFVLNRESLLVSGDLDQARFVSQIKHFSVAAKLSTEFMDLYQRVPEIGSAA